MEKLSKQDASEKVQIESSNRLGATRIRLSILTRIELAAMRLHSEQCAPFLDERGRRLFAAREAQREGPGGVTALSKATSSVAQHDQSRHP